MKKAGIFCVISFSALILVAMVLFIINLTQLTSSAVNQSFGQGNAIAFGVLGILTMVTSITAGIGTFVSSIVCLVQSKALNEAKGLMKGATITGIVGGALSMTFFLIIPAAIVIIVTFGLIIGAFLKAKRAGELI